MRDVLVQLTREAWRTISTSPLPQKFEDLVPCPFDTESDNDDTSESSSEDDTDIIEYQTRDADGYLRFFRTFEMAFYSALLNPETWKLSWAEMKSQSSEHLRILLSKTRQDKWEDEEERKLVALNADYSDEKSTQLRWCVDQRTMSKLHFSSDIKDVQHVYAENAAYFSQQDQKRFQAYIEARLQDDTEITVPEDLMEKLKNCDVIKGIYTWEQLYDKYHTQ
jgi:hypothetical protein